MDCNPYAIHPHQSSEPDPFVANYPQRLTPECMSDDAIEGASARLIFNRATGAIRFSLCSAEIGAGSGQVF